MASTAPRPLKVEHEFTDARLTGFGGCSALALTADRLGLFGDLAESVSVKVRRSGPWCCTARSSAGCGRPDGCIRAGYIPCRSVPQASDSPKSRPRRQRLVVGVERLSQPLRVRGQVAEHVWFGRCGRKGLIRGSRKTLAAGLAKGWPLVRAGAVHGVKSRSTIAMQLAHCNESGAAEVWQSMLEVQRNWRIARSLRRLPLSCNRIDPVGVGAASGIRPS